MIKILPETIHYEISLWLPYEDKISFASVNVMLSQHLLKRVRKISLDDEDEENWVNLYLTSDSFREKIHGLIVDPSNQLSLIIGDTESLTFEDVNGISCFELEISVNDLIDSLMDHIQTVKSLRLHLDGVSSDSLEIIAQWINNNPSLSVTTLAVEDEVEDDSTDAPVIPVIPGLESLAFYSSPNLQIDGLHIPSYSHLRILKLTSCSSIEDVSSLDRIHELHLIQCEEIDHISCLNNNYKIVIKDCESIINYSNCFRHSKIVEICCFYSGYVYFDFSKLLEVREISITVFSQILVVNFEFPSSPHLRQVYLKGLGCPFTIPSDNRIRVIGITECPKFTSFLHFDYIRSVYLENLQITTLEGLGSGNRVVQIRNCPFLTDFSGLRHCDKVSILKCKGFQDISQLRGVKDFTFSPVEHATTFSPFKEDFPFFSSRIENNKLPEDLEGVTCLSLQTIPGDSYSIKYPKSAKKLEFDGGSFDQFPSFFARLPPHISEVKVHMSKADFDLYRRWNSSMDEENFLPDFIIEFRMTDVHFLRKLH